MKRIISCLLLIKSFNLIAQDTLQQFRFNKFNEESKFLIKQTAKNEITTFEITEDSIRFVVNNSETNKLRDFVEAFPEKSKKFRQIILTDTSLIVLRISKESDFNTLKYEYSFKTQKTIFNHFNISELDDKKLLNYSIVNQNFQFVRLEKDTLSFICLNDKYQAKRLNFSVNEMSKTSKLKIKEINKYFLQENLPITYYGDIDILKNDYHAKCYITNDTAYILSNGLNNNEFGVFIFSFKNNSVAYTSFKQDQSFCKKYQHTDHYYRWSMINRKIVVSRNCSHNITICMYDPITGETLKKYSVDSTESNPLQNVFVKKAKFGDDEYEEEIKKEKVFGTPYDFKHFSICVPVNENEFNVIAGVYKTKITITQYLFDLAGMMASAMILANGGAIFTASSSIIGTDYYMDFWFHDVILNSIGHSINVYNRDKISKARYVSAFFSSNTLDETKIEKSNLQSKQQHSTLIDNAIAKFTFNGKQYAFNFYNFEQGNNCFFTLVK